MTVLENFYSENLYPFQDGVLNIVKQSSLPFFLTGGTALSRYYFHHRYSDDLDFFVNDDPGFARHVDILTAAIKRNAHSGLWELEETMSRRGDDFAQLLLRRGDVILKIDMVNDIASHFGDFVFDAAIGKIDSWRNILSNKLTAIYRYAPKDIADIWILSKQNSFSWEAIIREAKTKEMGLEPISISEIIRTMPPSSIDQIRWMIDIDKESFLIDLNVIANDLLLGTQNSLSH